MPVKWQEDKHVCCGCFSDPGLVQFVQLNAVSKDCSFCPSVGCEPIAAPIDEVHEHFIACLRMEYDIALNQLGWEGAEGGWVGAHHWNSDDLLFYELGLDFPQDNQDDLLPYLLGDYIDEEWCERDAYGLNYSEAAQYSWADFRDTVMHKRRFFFWDYDSDPEDRETHSPSELLRTIFEYSNQVGLFEQVSSGTRLFRARYEGRSPRFKTPEDLGPPPQDKATQNRMSPAGIPMLYACDDIDTAIKEVSGEGLFAVGTFETLRPALILDLTEVPEIPSLFQPISDSVEFSPRQVLIFLHHVAQEMSRPIQKDNRIHTEYIPTQVVTEFVRHRVMIEDARVDGIKYPSSVNPGHASYVLFADQSNVVPSPSLEERSLEPSKDRWLKLVATCHRWA